MKGPRFRVRVEIAGLGLEPPGLCPHLQNRCTRGVVDPEGGSVEVRGGGCEALVLVRGQLTPPQPLAVYTALGTK